MTTLQHNKTTAAKSTSNLGVAITAFKLDDVTYAENGDLGLQLRLGGNEIPGSLVEEGQVLVKLNVDGEKFDAVEVSRCRGKGDEADTIDAAIESLIKVRDALRKMAAVAA